jgi:anti-anti-sigma factor
MVGSSPHQDPAGPRLTAELRQGVLVVHGEIDAVSVASVVAALRAAARQPGGHRIDLTDVRFIDSRGIEALFALAPDGLEITVTEGSLMQRILRTVAMDQVAKIRTRP